MAMRVGVLLDTGDAAACTRAPVREVVVGVLILPVVLVAVAALCCGVHTREEKPSVRC